MKPTMSFTTLQVLAATLAISTASPLRPFKRQSTTPVLSSATVLGLLSDPTWNRDSCTSVGLFGREFWTCRDSQSSTAFISSSASWTDFNSDGTPSLTMYGTNSDEVAYFPVQADECGGSAGACPDGTRYAIWYVSTSQNFVGSL